jgi:hypothetical protein
MSDHIEKIENIQHEHISISPDELICYFMSAENKLNFMIDNSQCEEFIKNDVYKRSLFEICKSYLLGEYEENDYDDISTFVHLYYNYLCDNTSNQITKFITEFLEYLSSTCEQNDDIFEILQRMIYVLHNVKKYINTKDKQEIHMIKLKIIKEIWSYKQFRNCIGKFKQQSTGEDYSSNGFLVLLTVVHNSDVKVTMKNYIDAISPLLDDKETHEQLLSYIYNILMVNMPYTYQDIYYIGEKKCSTCDYMSYIMEILFNMVSIYGIENILQNIQQSPMNEKIDMTECEKLPFYHKLYAVSIFSIYMCHTSILRIYSLLKNQSVIMSLLRVTNKKTEILNIAKLIKSTDDSMINKLYASYANSHKFINLVGAFADIVYYLDHVSSGSTVENIKNGNIDPRLLNMLSHICGGNTSDQCNVHTRYNSCILVLKMIPTYGFNSFENLFENLFKYLSNVKFTEWLSPKESIQHTNKLVETIYYLIDLNDEKLNESDSIVLGTLFVLLRSAIKSLSQIKEVCALIKNAEVRNGTELIKILVQTITSILRIHSNIYSKKIITETYSEAETEYIMLISGLLEAVVNPNHELYKIAKRPDFAATITHAVFDSIDNHIEYCGEILSRIKDIIIQNIGSYSRLSAARQSEIIEKLESYVDIDYPEEFMDQMLCIPIKNPIKIAGANEFFDKASIATHILEFGNNPLTKETMTMDDLNKYNEGTDIKNEVKNFMNRKRLFEEEYALKHR